MHRNIICYLCFVFTLLVAPAHGAQGGPSTDSTRVLFIGNSYIYYNNLPQLFAEVAASKGHYVDAEMAVRDGARLLEHAADQEIGKRIREGDWDYVVLQEQSTLGGSIADGRLEGADINGFFEAARSLHAAIKASGAQTVFHLTWARKHSPQMLDDLVAAYEQIASELDAEVAPVGKAWAVANAEVPSANLYLADDSHPSSAGSYLSAVTLYATLFDESPKNALTTIIGHPVEDSRVNEDEIETLVDLSAKDARILQGIAWRIYKQEHE